MQNNHGVCTVLIGIKTTRAALLSKEQLEDPMPTRGSSCKNVTHTFHGFKLQVLLKSTSEKPGLLLNHRRQYTGAFGGQK